MNPQGVYNIGGNAPPYNLAEIWPSFNGGGASESVCPPPSSSINAADDLAASINRKMNMSLNVNLLNPNPNPNPNPIDDRVRRRRHDEDACGASTSLEASMNDCSGKRIKKGSELNENSVVKEEGGVQGKRTKVAEKAAEPPPKQDYIHVRARRGQATDNHSLAERARREKISEKMKTLQDLVPGCNKVIGKAVVLDEIINYVQSLQRQVEFLSMKLEAVNSRQGTGMEGFPLKDFGQQQFDTSGMPFEPHSSRDYSRGASPEWLHMQIGSGFDIKSDTH